MFLFYYIATFPLQKYELYNHQTLQRLNYNSSTLDANLDLRFYRTGEKKAYKEKNLNNSYEQQNYKIVKKQNLKLEVKLKVIKIFFST